jgi:polyvinyl alcohol dehydrogenase (cytochrome)
VHTCPVQLTPVQLTHGQVTCLILLAPLALLLTLAGCTSAGQHVAVTDTSRPAQGAADTTASTAKPTNWLQYHGNAARSGVVSGLPPAGHLAVAWTRRLDGAVYGQPLVIGSTIVAATEKDEVYGLNRATGAIRWRRKVGTPLPLSEQPCGNISPLGITSTPVYDPQTKLVYVVAQNGKTGHLLAGLRISDGHIAFTAKVPSPDHEPFYDQQRGALALTDGHIYVVFGGHFGDCGPYRGTVVAMPASGHGRVWHYVVPTAKQGGIWASGGPVVGPNGTIYISTGNGAPTSKRYDSSDSVTALTPALKEIGIFAPTDWRMLSADDLDLGSMSPALMSDGRILQVGKSAVGYLVNSAHLGGVGGQLAKGPVCTAFGGAAVSGHTVYVPCISGLAAVNTARGRVRVTWRGPAGVWGSPVLGGGAVWVASPSTGVLYELAPRTGRVREKIKIARQLPDFVSPSLSGGLVLVGTMTGVSAISGG